MTQDKTAERNTSLSQDNHEPTHKTNTKASPLRTDKRTHKTTTSQHKKKTKAMQDNTSHDKTRKGHSCIGFRVRIRVLGLGF
jgi:hypothetical protein